MQALNINAAINLPGAITQFMTTGKLPPIGGPLRPVHHFDLLHKSLDLGHCQIKQFWIDRNKLYPTRNRCALMFRPIVDAYWNLCRFESADQAPEVQEAYLLARLLPDIRDHKAREVFRDSVSSRRFDVEPKENAANDLESMLSLHSEPMSVPDFHRYSADLLGPPEYAEEGWELYDEMSEQLLAPGRELLGVSESDAIAAVRGRWRDWLTRIARRHGKERQKLMLAVLSHESKAAYHRAYSAIWQELIQVLRLNGHLDALGARFHRFWHRTLVQQSDEYPTQCAHLFHGHIFALHPASAMFIQTAAGRRLIGDWLLNDIQETYEKMLGGLAVALSHYTSVHEQSQLERRRI